MAGSSSLAVCSVVPTSMDASAFTSDTADMLRSQKAHSATKNSTGLVTFKLPGCAYTIGIRRAENFGKISFMALFFTCVASILKYIFASNGEYQIIQAALENTADVLAKTLKLQIESDMSSLDGVANLWLLSSNISRASYRQYIVSDYYRPNLASIESCMLVHRVRPWQREAVETEASSLQTYFDCCNGTKYDNARMGFQCRSRSQQCRIPGDRFHFVAKTEQGKFVRAPYDDKDNIIVTYMEPLENNPVPQGLDMCSLGVSNGCRAWHDSERTGLPAMTKRWVRLFDPSVFCVQLWNPVFVDKTKDGNKTIFEGVDLMSKKTVIEKGGEPYAIGAVAATYKPQKMLKNLVERVFGKGLRNTRVYLLDERPWVGETNRLIAMWDADLSEAEMKNEAIRLRDFSKERLVVDKIREVRNFEIDGTGESTTWSMMVIPNERFVDELRSHNPLLILVLSLVLMLVAQAERWLGHPTIVSSSKMIRSRIAAEIRCDLEAKIQAEVDLKVRQEEMRRNDSESFTSLS